jgi:hypothetical protein
LKVVSRPTAAAGAGNTPFSPTHYIDTPTFSVALQVGLGGVLVFAIGVLIGSS